MTRESGSVGRGVDGWVDDDIAMTKPWGFDVADIKVPVLLTYGRTDTLVPAAHGDWLAAHMEEWTVTTRRAPKVTVTRERVSLCQKGVTRWLLFLVN